MQPLRNLASEMPIITEQLQQPADLKSAVQQPALRRKRKIKFEAMELGNEGAAKSQKRHLLDVGTAGPGK